MLTIDQGRLLQLTRRQIMKVINNINDPIHFGDILRELWSKIEGAHNIYDMKTAEMAPLL